MTSAQQKFQALLRELFQFDCADLDFGIYRIMNQKRTIIEEFITTNLPQTIDAELNQGALGEQRQAAKDMKALAFDIRQAIGSNALDVDGNLVEKFHDTNLGQRYLIARDRAAGIENPEAIEVDIFNHLFAFFSRYYQEGDFISKRRYTKQQKYAIPYNGEEVYLHWANHDQYYVKTAEQFHDYSFVSQAITVQFKLTAADVEQNNVKGEKRFFLPQLSEIVWDDSRKQLTIPFVYRPLTDEETAIYGTKNQQETIIAEAVTAIPQQLQQTLPRHALLAERDRDSDGQTISYLAYHLRKYTQLNTADFFIHKNLRAFLQQELDFYLKSEVVNLDNILAAGEGRAERWFQQLRVIKAVGGQIIDFLHQIESFQKMLWEKRKFITETQYCLTVGIIEERFYPEIAACEAQWAEWQTLYQLDETQADLFTNGKSQAERRIIFLQRYPTLVLDTQHFDPLFVEELLASFDDLDDYTDGLLIHSENWQALNFLVPGYQGTVSAIYIDPPYNTNGSVILYKNEYRHSSWLALIENRLTISNHLLSLDGILCITIDDIEYHRLKSLIEREFGTNAILGCATIRNNPSGRATPKGFSIAHEYALFVSADDEADIGRLPHSEEQKSRYAEQDDEGNYEWVNFRKHGGANAYRSARPAMFYPIYVKGNRVRIPEMSWDAEKKDWQVREGLKTSEKMVLPIRVDGDKSYEMTWKWGVETARMHIEELQARTDQRGEIGIYRKSRLRLEGTLPRTWWDKKSYSATEYGTNLLVNIMGEANLFSFPKSVHAVEDCLRVAGLDENGTVIDYFGGSGTTAHAVINLNRADDGERRFILVEMGDYFETVLLPRIKKISFTPEWKDGKPKRLPTPEETARSPRIVKYIRLESYEDTLNNIAFDEDEGQIGLPFDDYLLSYMLKWESRSSETLLNVKDLSTPFRYKLTVRRDGVIVDKQVDIPETFNYLLGLRVRTRRVYNDDGRRYLVYHGQYQQRQVAVIWRDCAGWQPADFQRDQQFVTEQKLTADADEVFINGDSYLANAQAIEPMFKTRMFATVEGES